MKHWYPNIYEFIWLCIYRHCLRLFSVSKNPETLGLSSRSCLEELGMYAQDKLELIRENRCLIQLFKTYFSFLKIARSIHHELKLQIAKRTAKKLSSHLFAGKCLLLVLLIIHTGIGFALTLSYQTSNGYFSYGASFIAILSYLAIAWCIFKSRALPLFRTTLIALITLTGFNSFFSNLWHTQIGATCYSEICTLIDPNSIFQSTTIKIFLIAFWSLTFILISFKNPIKRYLVYNQSADRRL